MIWWMAVWHCWQHCSGCDHQARPDGLERSFSILARHCCFKSVSCVSKMASEKVTIYNRESDTLIEVVLSTEDAQRVTKDLSFATAVMRAAVQESKDKEGQETETEVDSLPLTPEVVYADMKGEETQETETQMTNDGEEGSVYRWTTPCVLLLLDTYKDVEEKMHSGKQSQKKVWEEVSAVLAKRNFKVTGPQCAAKLRSLKKSYRSVSSKSGNDRKTWQFYEIMDSIFSKKALASASSLSTRAERSSSPSTDTNDELPMSTSPRSPAPKINVLLAKRIRQKEEHEEARAKRHKERMDMDKKLLKMLEKISK